MGKKKINFYKYSAKEVFISFQHMFAMLGATILVPILTNMSIPMALISAGLGTIAFHFISKRKVPVFLGSSFAFLPALISIVAGSGEKYSTEWQNSMAVAVLCIVLAGLVYVGIAGIIKLVGAEKVKKFFPPVVIGPVIIIIGMILAPKMFWNNILFNYLKLGSVSWKEWSAAIVTALTILLISAFSKPKSFLKVIPVLLGFVVGYIYSAIIGLLNFEGAFSADRIIIFQNIGKEFSFYKGFANITGTSFLTGFLAVVPVAIVTFMEHLGDISANSYICGQDFMVDPGLNRTILGDGVGTIISGLLGGPPNTTYGENTAVLAITKNYEPKNVFLAGVLAVIFGVFSVFGDLLATIPSAVIGGASIVLFGMISASGLRVLVDAKVDFTDTRNMMIVSVILATGLGLGALSLAGDIIGGLGLEYIQVGGQVIQIADSSKLKIMAGSVEISPLAIATVLGILLNIIYPTEENVEKLRAKISKLFKNIRKKSSEKESEDTAVEKISDEADEVEVDQEVIEENTTKQDAE